MKNNKVYTFFSVLFACLFMLFSVPVSAEGSLSVSDTMMNVSQVLDDDSTGQEYRNTLFDGSQGGILNNGKRPLSMSSAPGGLNWSDFDAIHFDINIAPGGMEYDNAFYTLEFVYYNDKSPLSYENFVDAFYYHYDDYRSELTKQDVYVGPVDVNKYPNPFESVDDASYSSYAKIVRFSFEKASYTDGTIYTKFNFYSSTEDSMSYGLAYCDLYVSSEEADVWYFDRFLSQFKMQTNFFVDIYNNLVSFKQSFDTYATDMMNFMNKQMRTYLARITDSTKELVSDGRDKIRYDGDYTILGRIEVANGNQLTWNIEPDIYSDINTGTGEDLTQFLIRYNFNSSTFEPGVPVHFRFVTLLDPTQHFELDKVTAAYTTGSGTVTLNLNDDFVVTEVYSPYTFVSTDFTLEEIANSFRMIEGIFTPTGSGGSLTFTIPIEGAPENAKPSLRVGVGSPDFYVSYNDKLMSSLDGIHSGIGSIAAAITNAFTMSDDDEGDFDQMEKDEQEKAQQTQEKINENKEKLDKIDEDTQSKQDTITSQQQSLKDHEQREEEFKDQYVDKKYNEDITASINTEISGTYAAGFIWWGNAMEEILSFESVKTMLYVVVFFSLLMMMFNSGMRSVIRMDARERRAGSRMQSR